MVTVLRAAGFRIVIFTNDHAPAHVHVYGDGEAKIDIAADVKLMWATDMTRADIRRIMAVVRDNRDELLERWKAIHAGPHR